MADEKQGEKKHKLSIPPAQEQTTSGAAAGNDTKDGVFSIAEAYDTPIGQILYALQKVAEGGGMPELTAAIVTAMPLDMAGASQFVAQLKRLKDATERAYTEGLQHMFVIQRGGR